MASLTPFTLEDFLTQPFPARTMLLAPWLPQKGLAMVYGPRGLGKTHFAIGVAVAVATGGTFLGWKAPTPVKVLIIDGEMPAVDLQERLAAAFRLAGGDEPAGDMIRIVSADQEPNGIGDLSTEDGQAQLDEVIDDAGLIILDNLSSLTRSGRENEAESWSIMQSWMLAKRRDGQTVLFVHHAGKGGAQRGTSRREDVLDTVINLRRPPDYEPKDGARFEVNFEKSRGFRDEDAEPLEAALTDEGWTISRDSVAARVLELRGGEMTQRKIAEELGISASTVNRILKRSDPVS